jgi:hypothetical protein
LRFFKNELDWHLPEEKVCGCSGVSYGNISYGNNIISYGRESWQRSHVAFFLPQNPRRYYRLPDASCYNGWFNVKMWLSSRGLHYMKYSTVLSLTFTFNKLLQNSLSLSSLSEFNTNKAEKLYLTWNHHFFKIHNYANWHIFWLAKSFFFNPEEVPKVQRQSKNKFSKGLSTEYTACLWDSNCCKIRLWNFVNPFPRGISQLLSKIKCENSWHFRIYHLGSDLDAPENCIGMRKKWTAWFKRIKMSLSRVNIGAKLGKVQLSKGIRKRARLTQRKIFSKV